MLKFQRTTKRVGWKKGFSLLELMVVLALIGIISVVVLSKSKGSVEDTEINSLWEEAQSIVQKHKSVGNSLGTYTGLTATEHIEHGLITHEIDDTATATFGADTPSGRIGSMVKKGCYFAFNPNANGTAFAFMMNCDDVISWSAGLADGENQAIKNRFSSVIGNGAQRVFGVPPSSISEDKGDGNLSIIIENLN